MIKVILKETCIMLLLCVAIVLVLGVIFYDYIPTNKAVPNKLATYETPENVQSEIDEKIEEMEKESVTYTITGADLNLYKQTNSYVSGKPDPFSASIDTDNIENGESEGAETDSGTVVSNTQTNTQTPSKDQNSTGTFFNDEGTK